jgi:hypothetical protein
LFDNCVVTWKRMQSVASKIFHSLLYECWQIRDYGDETFFARACLDHDIDTCVILPYPPRIVRRIHKFIERYSLAFRVSRSVFRIAGFNVVQDPMLRFSLIFDNELFGRSRSKVGIPPFRRLNKSLTFQIVTSCKAFPILKAY